MLKHAYHVNMGGLSLGTTSGEVIRARMSTVAITTRQFTYLRKKEIIQATPVIPEEEIEDMSKTD
jgi:hypothetical protein